MQEKRDKARVRAQILKNVESDEEHELQRAILGNRQQSLHFKQSNEEDYEESHSQQNIDYLNTLQQSEQEKRGFLQRRTLLTIAPDIELDVFDGSQFVEKRIDGPNGRLARLLK